MLDFNQIKELIKEIDLSSLRVFELENNDIKLKISKNDESYLYKETTFNANNITSSEKFNSSMQDINILDKEIVSKNEEIINEDLSLVKSPLVGTYYSSSAPGEAPYVEVGSKVKKR